MTILLAFLVGHWADLTALVALGMSAAGIIIRLTPTQVDDRVYAQVTNILKERGIIKD
jgi:hypothetical protein